MKIKIVKWRGRLDPSYEEFGEIETKMLTINNDEEESLCIEIEDLLEALNLR